MVGRHSGRPVRGVGWVVPPKAGSPTVRAAAWREVRRFRTVVGQPARGARAERPTLRLPYSSIPRDIRLGRVEPEWSGDIQDGRFGE
jgi:hypothetical protein